MVSIKNLKNLNGRTITYNGWKICYKDGFYRAEKNGKRIIRAVAENLRFYIEKAFIYKKNILYIHGGR
jgi:hypothetical protein